MWFSKLMREFNYARMTPVFLVLVAIVISFPTILANDQNVTVTSSTTAPTRSPTPPKSRPILNSTGKPIPSTSKPSTPRISTLRPSTLRPRSSTSRPRSTTTTSTPVTSTSTTSTPPSNGPPRTRSRTPNLEEFPVVQEPQNNELIETDDPENINDTPTTTEQLDFGQENSTQKKATTPQIVDSAKNVNVKSTANFTKTVNRKNTKGNATLPTRRNSVRRKSNATLSANIKFINTTTIESNTTTTNSSSTSSRFSSLASNTFPSLSSKMEYAKMCALGDAIIPATCFSCRCGFNGIFNEWTCIKDDLCMWANHNANLAKREKIKRRPSNPVSITKKVGTNGKHVVGGNRAESEPCRRGQYYQDECQYCICAVNGLYQCSDLCSRIGGPSSIPQLPQGNQHLPFYNGPERQSSNYLSGPQMWNSGPGTWSGNSPNYYNQSPNSGGVYNPQWGWDYPNHRSFVGVQLTPSATQNQNLSDKKNKTTSVVKPEKTTTQKT